VCTSEMATPNDELPIPRAEGERDDNVVPVNPVLEEVRAPRELNEDRYRLKAPTFTGEEEVEQFIQEFNDVMEVTQWPPRVALLKLRMSLMDKAKPYGLDLTLTVSLLLCGLVLASPPSTPVPGYKGCDVILTRRYKNMLPW